MSWLLCRDVVTYVRRDIDSYPLPERVVLTPRGSSGCPPRRASSFRSWPPKGLRHPFGLLSICQCISSSWTVSGRLCSFCLLRKLVERLFYVHNKGQTTLARLEQSAYWFVDAVDYQYVAADDGDL